MSSETNLMIFKLNKRKTLFAKFKIKKPEEKEIVTIVVNQNISMNNLTTTRFRRFQLARKLRES